MVSTPGRDKIKEAIHHPHQYMSADYSDDVQLALNNDIAPDSAAHILQIGIVES